MMMKIGFTPGPVLGLLQAGTNSNTEKSTDSQEAQATTACQTCCEGKITPCSAMLLGCRCYRSCLLWEA